MKPIFSRGPSLKSRLFLAIIFSIMLLTVDSRIESFSKVRVYLNTVIAPVQFIANLPQRMFDGLFKQFNTKQDLLVENNIIKKQLLLLKSETLRLEQFKQENERLRELLGSPLVRDERKMVAQVMAVSTDHYRNTVMIDKGYINGVYENQPVINEKGVVGQVNKVGAHYSQVLLIVDNEHALPVQVVRNDIRTIAVGCTQSDKLELEYLPSSTDIRAGDELVTSGLGGVFPEGYPVGQVEYFKFDNQRPFAEVKLKPSVDFNRLRYVLLVWAKETEQLRDAISIQNAHSKASR